jgi:hypothetical protein
VPPFHRSSSIVPPCHLPHPPRRDEFKRHKKADPKWLGSFFREWEAYLEMVQKQSVAEGRPMGSALPQEAMRDLTDEQKVQLEALKKEATSLYKDG